MEDVPGNLWRTVNEQFCEKDWRINVEAIIEKASNIRDEMKETSNERWTLFDKDMQVCQSTVIDITFYFTLIISIVSLFLLFDK